VNTALLLLFATVTQKTLWSDLGSCRTMDAGDNEALHEAIPKECNLQIQIGFFNNVFSVLVNVNLH
jgi:hypothetical protein